MLRASRQVILDLADCGRISLEPSGQAPGSGTLDLRLRGLRDRDRDIAADMIAVLD
jgi:hypothetical protein